MPHRIVALVALSVLAAAGLASGPAGAEDPPIPGLPPLATPTPAPTAAPTAAPPEATPVPETAPARGPTREAPAPAASSVDAAVAAVSGTGMYVWRWERTGPVAEVVQRAKDAGMSFLIVRASSQSQGFYLEPILAELLPAAHAAGLKVVAYDPPRFEDVEADAQRARALASFRVQGHGIDAFAADIEPRWELFTAENAEHYGARLRELLGPDFPMIAVTYPPNHVGDRVPFAQIARHFDVLSPMSYWRAQTLDSSGYMAASVRALAAYGRPVTAIGQAFSYHDHRNPALRGHPPPPEFEASIVAAREAGAVGISFWVWEHAEPWVFDSIRQAAWPGAGTGIGLRPPPIPLQGEETPAEVEASVAFGPEVDPAPRADAPAADTPWRPSRAATVLMVLAGVLVWRREDLELDPGRVRGALTLAVEAAERGAAPIVASRLPSPPGSGRSARAARSGRGAGSGRSPDRVPQDVR